MSDKIETKKSQGADGREVFSVNIPLDKLTNGEKLDIRDVVKNGKRVLEISAVGADGKKANGMQIGSLPVPLNAVLDINLDNGKGENNLAGITLLKERGNKSAGSAGKLFVHNAGHYELQFGGNDAGAVQLDPADRNNETGRANEVKLKNLQDNQRSAAQRGAALGANASDLRRWTGAADDRAEARQQVIERLTAQRHQQIADYRAAQAMVGNRENMMMIHEQVRQNLFAMGGHRCHPVVYQQIYRQQVEAVKYGQIQQIVSELRAPMPGLAPDVAANIGMGNAPVFNSVASLGLGMNPTVAANPVASFGVGAAGGGLTSQLGVSPGLVPAGFGVGGAGGASGPVGGATYGIGTAPLPPSVGSYSVAGTGVRPTSTPTITGGGGFSIGA